MNQKNDPNRSNPKITEDQQVMIDALATALLRASQQQQGGMPAAAAVQLQAESVKTIDLIELFYHILSKFIFILIGAVVCAAVMWYTASDSVPIYTATSKLYIVGNTGTTVNIADLQLGNLLSMDYEEVFKTWEVHEMVREELNLNYSYAAMQAMITVTRPEDTRVLYISVRNPNAQMATDLANAYAKAAKTFILQTMDAEEPNIFSVALVPSSASVVTKTSRVILGFLIGTVLSVGLIVLRFIFDDRPRTPEDIAKVAGIPTLAVIPMTDRRMRSKLRSYSRRDYYESN